MEPDYEAKNVLLVCKLNPLTEDEDLHTIFSRFGVVTSAEVIRDKNTGDSLCYAFIEFEDKDACEQAYFKMDNALIDDRRIHLDFSQSVSKLWSQYRRKGQTGQGGGCFKCGSVDHIAKDCTGDSTSKQPSLKYTLKDDNRQSGGDGSSRYEMVFEEDGDRGWRHSKIEVETVDRTSTLLGTVWQDKVNMAIPLLEAGLAKIQAYSPEAHLLVQAEQSAKQKKLKVRENYVEGEEVTNGSGSAAADNVAIPLLEAGLAKIQAYSPEAHLLVQAEQSVKQKKLKVWEHYLEGEEVAADRRPKEEFKMDNALIDDRRIHLDFSQSVSKLWSQYRRKGQTGQGSSWEHGTTNLFAKLSDTVVHVALDGRTTRTKYKKETLKTDNRQKYILFEGGIITVAGDMRRWSDFIDYLDKELVMPYNVDNILSVAEIFFKPNDKESARKCNIHICGWVAMEEKYKVYKIGDFYPEPEEQVDTIFGGGTGYHGASRHLERSTEELTMLSLNDALARTCLQDVYSGGCLRGFTFRDGEMTTHEPLYMWDLLINRDDYDEFVFEATNLFVIIKIEDQFKLTRTDLKNLAESKAKDPVVDWIGETDVLLVYLVRLDSLKKWMKLMGYLKRRNWIRNDSGEKVVFVVLPAEKDILRRAKIAGSLLDLIRDMESK